MGFTTFQKIVHSLWIIFTFIFFLNGIGFIYIGLKVNEIKWVISGIIYEIPWILCFIFVDAPDSTFDIVAGISFLLMIISIIHAFLIRSKYLRKLESMQNRENHYINYNDVYVPNDNPFNKPTGVNANVGERTIDFNFAESNTQNALININTASEAELSSLPGINIILAKRIVELRKVHSFSSAEQLGAELNLKPHIINNLRKIASFEVVNNNVAVQESNVVDNTPVEDSISVGDNVSEESLDTNANDFDNQDNSSTIDKKGRKLDF